MQAEKNSHRNDHDVIGRGTRHETHGYFDTDEERMNRKSNLGFLKRQLFVVAGNKLPTAGKFTMNYQGECAYN